MMVHLFPVLRRTHTFPVSENLYKVGFIHISNADAYIVNPHIAGLKKLSGLGKAVLGNIFYHILAGLGFEEGA
jgi:hypothetical protein